MELDDIKLKLKGSLIPFNKSFNQSIETRADLYGPFWIFTTIIFLIALIGNFSTYFYSEDRTKFVYDYSHVIDFNDKISWHGNTYYLRSNSVSITETVKNKQTLEFVRWY